MAGKPVGPRAPVSAPLLRMVIADAFSDSRRVVLGLSPRLRLQFRIPLPRHYFRYSGLFHKSEYNLITTTTKTPAPRRTTVSNALSGEPITCPSCEYRYPRSAAICVMCGTAAPSVEPLRPLSSVPDEFSGADRDLGP